MTITKEKIINVLIGAIISGAGFLVLSIYGDFLPNLMPSLLGIPTEIYLKLIGLLALLLALLCITAVLLYQKAKEYKPLVVAGKNFGYTWSAKIGYEGSREPINIDLQWICPQHKTFLGCVSAEVPETAYNVLWCMKCNRTYPMESGGSSLYLQEAEGIVKRNILGKIRVAQKNR